MHLDGAADDDITPHDAASSSRLIEGREKAARAPRAGALPLAWPLLGSLGAPHAMHGLDRYASGAGLPLPPQLLQFMGSTRESLPCGPKQHLSPSMTLCNKLQCTGAPPECWWGAVPLERPCSCFNRPKRLLRKSYWSHKHRRIAIGCFGAPSHRCRRRRRRGWRSQLPVLAPVRALCYSPARRGAKHLLVQAQAGDTTGRRRRPWPRRVHANAGRARRAGEGQTGCTGKEVGSKAGCVCREKGGK